MGKKESTTTKKPTTARARSRSSSSRRHTAEWHHGPNVERGWHGVEPKDQHQRKALVRKCGGEDRAAAKKKCFLDPKNLKYPICPKDACQPTCRGLAAARSRAAQMHRKDLVAKADRLAKARRCH